MILHSQKFNVQARLRFQPFDVEWHIVSVEVVEWAENQSILRPMSLGEQKNPEMNWLKVHVVGPDMKSKNALGLMLGFGLGPVYTVLVDRAGIPPHVLQPHEHCRNTPDVSGRPSFSALICHRPEFKAGAWTLTPGSATKNAWAMRNEFLNLAFDCDDDFEQLWSLRNFLNKWGLWESGDGFAQDRGAIGSLSDAPERPDFVLVMPHLLRQQQVSFLRVLPAVKAREWLRSHPLTLEPEADPPYLFVRQHYCKGAIEATITIDHLTKRQSVLCRRCNAVFQPEPRKVYCSRTCASAAGVERFRENMKKLTKKKAQRRK